MNQDSINFLRDSLMHHRDLRNGLDQKASIILGFSSVIFTLSVGHLEELQFLIIAVSSFFTALFSIFAIFMPFRRDAKDKFSLMCWWGFRYKGFDDYKKDINNVFNSDEAVAQEYMKEIWGLANYSLAPKNRYLKIASIILIVGLLIGFVLFFI